MKNITILIFFCILPNFSFCQVVIDDNFTSMTLEDKMQLYNDPTDSLTINDFINTSNKFNFKNIEYASPNIGRDTHNNWIVFELNNISNTPKNVYLYLSQPFIDFLNIYVLENGEIKKEAVFQYEEKLKKGLLVHLARPTLEIETKPNTSVKVYIKLRNTAGVMILGMELMEKEDFFKKTGFEQNLYTIFFGIILAFSMLSITFFFISKSKLYLYYGLYIIFIDISFQGLIGNLYNISSFKLDFFNGDSCFRFYAILGLIFNVLFLQKLFETPRGRNFYNIFCQIILFLCTFVWIITVLDWGFIYYPLAVILNPYTLFILMALVSVFYNRKRRPNTVKLYAISFLPIILVLIVRILSEENFIETPLNFSHFVLPSLAFEFLILLGGLSKIFIQKLNERNALEAKIITSQIETQEAERKHIAQDLHDDLGATLSALKGRNKQEEFSEETQNLLNKAITDLRAISRRLLPADFEMFGFIPSVEKYIADCNKQQKLKVTFIAFGEVVKLNTEKELNIYRIITELVNNSMKYSNGKNATVQLIYHQNYLFVSVEDDGQVENKNENNLGIGLKNVISRLEYLNAKIIEKGGANGYSFIFEIPYKPNL